MIRKWAVAFFTALILAIVIRSFIFRSYQIFSNSMYSCLIPGDYVWVDKLSYGARLPVTPVSLPFLQRKIPFTRSNCYLSAMQLPPLRLPGFSSPQKDDIIVFNHPLEQELPIDRRKVIARRCMALPGDTLLIKQQKILVNYKKQSFQHDCIKKTYRVIINCNYLKDRFLKQYNLNMVTSDNFIGIFETKLSPGKAKKLSNEFFVKKIELIPYNLNNSKVYPFSRHIDWSRANYGPVIIPGDGMKIKWNTLSYLLYRPIIENYEGKSIEVRNNKVYVEGKKSNYYTFEQDYYFVLSDNRHSPDSREWGFIPESHIIGKAGFIWMSQSKKSIRLARIFKAL